VDFHEVLLPINELAITGHQFSVSFVQKRDKPLHVGVIKPANSETALDQEMVRGFHLGAISSLPPLEERA
jgi:hypothetical protein